MNSVHIAKILATSTRPNGSHQSNPESNKVSPFRVQDRYESLIPSVLGHSPGLVGPDDADPVLASKVAGRFLVRARGDLDVVVATAVAVLVDTRQLRVDGLADAIRAWTQHIS